MAEVIGRVVGGSEDPWQAMGAETGWIVSSRLYFPHQDFPHFRIS